jgi:type IV pilus assembly protein PilC
MTARRFSYKALDGRGKLMSGVMEAGNAEEVGTWLADRSYFVVEISAAPLETLAALPGSRPTLSNREMNYFLIQLSSLLEAGCPLIHSLQALHRQLPDSPLKTVLKDLKDKIEMGKSFSDALKGHPQIFSNLFITMVEVGEVGGILDEVLTRYAQMFDAMFRIRAKVIQSMIYPAILLIMTVLVGWALLVKVFPVFISQIESRGQLLPMPTRIVMGFSEFLSQNTWYLLGTAVFLVWLFRRVRATESGARGLSAFALGVPVFGALFRHIELSLFSRTLGTLLKCGVPILTSLTAVEKAMGNAVFKQALGEIKSGVARGESLSAGMNRFRDLFPDSLMLMVDVGERGGSTGDMLEKAGVLYERDLETTIDAVVSLIQPLLVVFLSIFIVTLAMAMYLPLFDIAKVVR